MPQDKGERPRSPPPSPPPGGGNPSKNRGKRRKFGMAAAADMPSVRALVKGHRGHRGHPNQCRQKTSTSDAADIEGGGLSRLGEGALAGQTPRQDGLRRRSKLRDRFGPRCRPRLQRRVGERFRPSSALGSTVGSGRFCYGSGSGFRSRSWSRLRFRFWLRPRTH